MIEYHLLIKWKNGTEETMIFSENESNQANIIQTQLNTCERVEKTLLLTGTVYKVPAFTI